MDGKWHGLGIDTPDPRGLATFYQELLGFVRVQDDDHWVVIGDSADRPGLAFQLAPDLQPPGWPDVGLPQQMHIDIAWTTSTRPRSKPSRLALCVWPVAVRLSGSTVTRRATRSVCAFRSLCRRPGCHVRLSRRARRS